MSKSKEILLLILSDFIFINVAGTIYYIIRIESGWIPYSTPTTSIIPLIIIYLYWIIIFSLAGLYKHWFVRPRFDEFSSITKTVSFGCLILFFVIFIDDTLSNAKVVSRFVILIYWLLLIIWVSIGRIIIRSFQINLLQNGIGLRNTFIIGTGKRAKDLNDMISKFPQLGYKIIGYISLEDNKSNSVGSINELPVLIEKNGVTEILIALESKQKDQIFKIIKYSPPGKVSLKILPDTYEIVSGMVKTHQLYGIPLIEVMPEIMSYTEKILKRIIDIIVSLIVSLILIPFIIMISLLIKITSKGPIFYNQIRIGKDGKKFKMYKFRTMIQNAEEYGPEWAGEKDPRITIIGKLLRRMYIDELPQIWNVLKNDMSLVGPRPERPHFVEILQEEIPYYYKRMSIKPGITGWAQIKHKYDRSLDDVRTKLQYDFYYIENMSLKLDFKIMINTIIVIIFMKGH